MSRAVTTPELGPPLASQSSRRCAATAGTDRRAVRAARARSGGDLALRAEARERERAYIDSISVVSARASGPGE